MHHSLNEPEPPQPQPIILPAGLQAADFGVMQQGDQIVVTAIVAEIVEEYGNEIYVRVETPLRNGTMSFWVRRENIVGVKKGGA